MRYKESCTERVNSTSGVFFHYNGLFHLENIATVTSEAWALAQSYLTALNPLQFFLWGYLVLENTF